MAAEMLEMLGQSSSQLFRYFQQHFSGFYFQDPEKKPLDPAFFFCFSASGSCAAPPVPRHVKQHVICRNYPKGGCPWGELTAWFRSAETLSYFQVVLKITQ